MLPTSIKEMPPSNKSKTFSLSLKLSTQTFYLAFGAQFAFKEAYFHIIKGRVTLSRLHNDLNTIIDMI
jgi:hypothetical protein